MRKCLTALTLLLALTGVPGLFAQSLTLETETGLALANAMLYPRGTYAGRDADGCRSIRAALLDEDRRLLRRALRHRGAGPALPVRFDHRAPTSSMTPSAIRAPAAWSAPIGSVRSRSATPARPGKSWSGASAP